MKISIVTVAYNAAATVADTVRSVLAQDWPNYEHLIIDGASSDATTQIVQGLAHDRLTLTSEPDAGCYDAMNKGLARATGDVVLFLNADDILARPDALRLVAQAFGDDSIDFVGGQTAVVAFDDLRKVKRLYRSVGFRPWMLSFGHMPPHPSFYARRKSLMAAGGFDTRYRIAADFDLMTRLFNGQAKFATLPQTLAAFREGGISTQNWDARMLINTEILQVLKSRGRSASLARLWARYPVKLLQLARRPGDYPASLERLGLAGSRS